MQSHTCHVNKTANFKTLTVLRQVTLRSGYCRIMFFSARRRERLGRGTGGRWMTGVTAGTATATGARVCGVKTHSSSSLSDSESVTSGLDDGDCWSAASMVLVASRGRRWCWWLAGVVGCGTATSVVLVASRGRQLWYLASVVLVAGHHHQGCLLRSGPWSLNLLWSRVAPLILLSQRQSCNGVAWSTGQDTGSGVNKVETTAGVCQQSVFTCPAADSFQHTHKIITLTHR